MVDNARDTDIAVRKSILHLTGRKKKIYYRYKSEEYMKESLLNKIHFDPSSAAINACRLVKEGGCDAVKLEGGQNMVSRIRAITENGMAVQGHIGLLPQHVSSIGGYRVQGKLLNF